MTMKIPSQSANGDYKYLAIYSYKTLHDMVNMVHKYICEINAWSHKSLKRGSYGYDNLVLCLGDFFKLHEKKHTKIEIAEIVHNAWVRNYIYWRDNRPWENKTVMYKKPFKPINDDHRNSCTVKYDLLPQFEKDKILELVNIFKEL